MSKVEGGKVFVEIGADPRKLFAALNKANKALAGMGKSLSSAGGKMMGLGAAALAPFAASVRSGSAYESTLLNIRASTGATAEEMERLRSASMTMSAAMGKGPTEIAGSFLELLKAGMKVEQVLGGAGKAAIEFAAVGQMEVADAAVVMSDAMNVFGVDASHAANAISSAADASSTSIQLMSQSFSMVSSVAKLANQSIDDTSAALAILANSGVKGSDAGTSLKTMLMRLMAPAEDAAKAMAGIKLSTDSFRNADGTMKPMVEIIRTLNGALGGMDQAAKDDIFRRIFGQDAIRAAAIMTNAGVSGFTAMRDSMGNAMPVGEKYKVLMSGLAGAGLRLMAAMERLAISMSDAVAPAVVGLADAIGPIISGFATFVSANKELVASLTQGLALFIGVGAAMWTLGKAVSFSSGVFAVLLNPLAAIPALLVVAVAAAMHFSGALDGLVSIATTTFNGIYEAIAAGDLAGAMDILWAGLYAGWLRGSAALMDVVDPWMSMFQNTFTMLGTEIAVVWESIYNGATIVWNNIAAVVMGVADNLVNSVMAAFDRMISAVRKSWNYVQSFIKRGYDLKKENEKVDSEMSARARQREVDRPGIEGRQREADKKNSEATRGAMKREKAMRDEADATVAGREDANRSRSAKRRAEAQAAEANVGTTIKDRRETRARNDQFTRLLKDIEGASSLDQLRDLYGEFDALSQNGRLTSGQQQALETALEDAQERVSKSSSSMGGASDASKKAEAAAASGASSVGKSQADVAGTFSSSLGGMGFGSSLVQKIVDYGKRTAEATEEMARGGAEVAP